MKKSKMAERFTEKQMYRLVQIYKEYDCLWNVSNSLYKNRDARNNAYMEICDKLNIPGLKVTDIPQKIKNLRSSYYQEIKRIDASIKDGNTDANLYSPKVSWFAIADGFLKTVLKSQNESFVKDRSITTEIMEKKFKKDNTQVRIESLDKIAGNIATHTQTNIIPHQNKTHELTEDEFDSFGKYIATSLRSMDRESSIIAKIELQKTLAKIQLRSMRQRKLPILPIECTASTSNDFDDPLESDTQSLFTINNLKSEFEEEEE